MTRQRTASIEPFGRIPVCVLDAQSALPHNEARLLLLLCGFCRGEGYSCHPGQETLAKLMGLKDAGSVRRILRKLEDGGFIKTKHRGRDGNLYEIQTGRPGARPEPYQPGVSPSPTVQLDTSNRAFHPPQPDIQALPEERNKYKKTEQSRPAAEAAQGVKAEADTKILELLDQHEIGEPNKSRFAKRCSAMGLGRHDVEQELAKHSGNPGAGFKVRRLEEWLGLAEKEAARKDACKKYCEERVGEIEAEYQQQDSPEDPEAILGRVLPDELDEVITKARMRLTSQLRSDSGFTEKEVAPIARSYLEDKSKPGVRSILARTAREYGHVKLPAKPAEQDDTNNTDTL